MSTDYFYISFAADHFLGATVVQAQDEASALAEATRRGLNPGGEAAIIHVPPEARQNPDMLAMVNRLVGEDEMLAMGARRLGDLPERIQERFEEEATVVCGDRNG
jgi:hypothetical protein